MTYADWEAEALSDGPLALWPFIANADAVVGIDAAAIGGCTFPAPGLLAGSDTCLTLDGSTGYVESGDADLGGGPFSLETWCSLFAYAPVGLNSALFDKQNTAYRLYVKRANHGTFPNRLALGSESGVDILVSTVPFPADGNRHHVVATYDGGDTGRIYLDGVDVSLQQAIVALTNNASPMWQGQDHGTAGFWNGRRHGSAVYQSVLSPARVLVHFLAGITNAGGSAVPWWLLDVGF